MLGKFTPNFTCIFKLGRRLRWNSTKSNNLGQGTFELEHEKLGTFPLFLVPIGPDHQGFRYQAVFNRFVKTQP